MHTDMDVVYTSQGGLLVEVLFLQLLNQLNTHHNVTTEHSVTALQHCLDSLTHEEKRRKDLIRQQQDDYSKLSTDYLDLQNLYLSAGKHIEDLEQSMKESFKKYEEKINTLERELEKETTARMTCEREGKLQKDYRDLEQINKELQEMKNCSRSDDEKINQIWATLQKISQNQDIGKDIYILEKQLGFAKEMIQNSTAMYASRSAELETERKKTQTLEERNAQLETSLRNLQEENQKLHTQLQAKAEQLANKDEQLQKKDNELADERQKNTQLQKMLEEMQRDSEKRNAELLQAERNNCSTQLQQQKTTSESKLKVEEEKTKQALKQLNSCNQLLNTAKQQTDVANTRVTKVIEFTNKYKKYLASGNINFAIAVYGDNDIKNMFRPLESITGKQMTDAEASKIGFSCANGRHIPSCFKCDGTDDCGNRHDELNCSSTVFPLGARVVRGTAWKWDNQDGDPPGVGTVIDEGENGGWNRVHWDSGHKNNYRIGVEREIDLRAAAGYFCGVLK